MIDFTKMKKKDLEHYLFIANQFYDVQTPEQQAETDAANAELERRMPKKDGKLSPAQKKVLDYIKVNADKDGEIYSKTLENAFNMRVIDNLIHKGVIERRGKSRLRTDDMEMVYWYVYCTVPTKLEKAVK